MRRWTILWVAALALFLASGCALQADGDGGADAEALAADQDALVYEQDGEMADDYVVVPVADELGGPDADTGEPVDEFEAALAGDEQDEPPAELEADGSEEEDPDPSPWGPNVRMDPNPDPWERPSDDWVGDEQAAGAHTTSEEDPADPDPSPWHLHNTEPTPTPTPLALVDVVRND